MMAITFLFLGPAPFFNLPTTMSIIEGVTGLGGIGYALVMISTFSRSHAEVLKKGFLDDIETYLMISGINLYTECVLLYLKAIMYLL